MEIIPIDVASASDTSSTTQHTPNTGSTYVQREVEQLHVRSQQSPVSHVSDIPWYDRTFLILERSTRRALTHTEHGLRVVSLEDDGPNPRNSWLCVNSNNYMGFMNKHSRCFLSHDGERGRSILHARVEWLKKWECFLPRIVPDGGYQILSPFWSDQMRILVVANGEGVVERAEHGDTTWVFEEV